MRASSRLSWRPPPPITDVIRVKRHDHPAICTHTIQQPSHPALLCPLANPLPFHHSTHHTPLQMVTLVTAHTHTHQLTKTHRSQANPSFRPKQRPSHPVMLALLVSGARHSYCSPAKVATEAKATLHPAPACCPLPPPQLRPSPLKTHSLQPHPASSTWAPTRSSRTWAVHQALNTQLLRPAHLSPDLSPTAPSQQLHTHPCGQFVLPPPSPPPPPVCRPTPCTPAAPSLATTAPQPCASNPCTMPTLLPPWPPWPTWP